MESKFIETDTQNFRNLWFLDKFLYGHKGYVAGGCFKNIFNKEKIKDIDIFFESEEDFFEAKTYFEDEIKGSPDKWKFSYENKNCWSVFSIKDEIRLELVKNYYGKPEDTIQTFDFTITKFAYYRTTQYVDSEGKIDTKVVYYKDFFEHLHLKRLVVDNRLILPANSFNRMVRYIGYGYLPCKETKAKIILELSKLDFDNKDDVMKLLGKSLYEGLD